MKRKVIQIAESTQLVSLPRKWAQKQGIKKGDELDIVEQGNKLIISTEEKSPKNYSTKIDIREMEPYLKYILQGMYKKGYDQVEILFKQPGVMLEIQELLHKETIGFEVVSQSKVSCTVRAVAGGFETEFETMLKRTFRILITLSEGVLDMMESKDASIAESTVYLESDNNKYASFCRRVLNKGRYKDSENSNLMYCIIEQLEQMADEYKYLLRYVQSNPDSLDDLSNDILNLFRDLTSYLKEASDLYYGFDMKKSTPFFKKRKEIIKKAYDLSKISKKTSHVRMMHYAINIAQKINDILRYKLEVQL